jgi:hypothetical protein
MASKAKAITLRLTLQTQTRTYKQDCLTAFGFP